MMVDSLPWSRRRVSRAARPIKARSLPPVSARRQFLFGVAVAVLVACHILAADAFAPSYVSSGHRRSRQQHKHQHQHERSSHRTASGRSQVASYSSSSSSVASGSVPGDEVCTVQILMSDTGGGHRASANALRDAFDALYPGKFECDIVDIYAEYGPFWPYNDYVAMYRLMSRYSWMWDLFYRFGETGFGLWLNEFLLTTFCYGPFKECIAGRVFDSTKKRADMVISVHPLCQDIPLKILAELDGKEERTAAGGSSKTPFVTVVTDLGGAHKTWFNPGVDKCLVPSDVLSQKAQSRGLDPASQIVQHGLPIRKGFWSAKSGVVATGAKSRKRRRSIPFFGRAKNGDDERSLSPNNPGDVGALRRSLGLDADLPTCLVVGGGDGMGGIVDIATTLGKKLGKSDDDPLYQMVVVCGNNQQAQRQLEKVDWGPGVEVDVQGFVNNMDEFMNAADCLVTKAGPGTIAEACICGLPCMLFAYLPGQEEGNVPFVEESGFGKYSSNPQIIADTVSSWLESPEKMDSMKAAALAAARPSATLDIAQDLAEIVFSTKKQTDAEKVLVAVR